MTAMNYEASPSFPLFLLGTDTNTLFVVPSIDGITLSVPDLIGLLPGGGGVTVFSVNAANKYTRTTVGSQGVQCPNVTTEMSPDCKLVPPKGGAIPCPSTIFGAIEAVSRLCVPHTSVSEAEAFMSLSNPPTGFWLLKVGESQWLTVEVGIDPS